MRTLRLTVWLHRRLWLLYPPSFRQQYAGAAALDFGEFCLQRYERHGPGGLWKAWEVMWLDLLHTLVREWASAGLFWRVGAFLLALSLFAVCWLGVEPALRCR